MNKKLEYLKKVAKPKKLDLNSISDLQQNISSLKDLHEAAETDNNNLFDGYQDYFNSLDSLIMDSAFIKGMSEKTENAHEEIYHLIEDTKEKIDYFISQFDELGIEPTPDFQNLLETFFDLHNAATEAYAEFDSYNNIRDEAEEVYNTTQNKNLNF
tara:strand:+ start:11081 stop:11548 length:468 start_codon:yes stop_codon:yes gene_type:complete